MRRTDKEITDVSFAENVLAEADLISVAFFPGPDDTAPYVIFMHPLFHEGVLYAHCATAGRKLELIKHNPNVAFTAAVDVHVVRKKFSTHYRSVCGTAVASLVTDEVTRCDLLAKISARYQTDCPDPIPPKMLERIAVLRMDITGLTGKFSEVTD